MTPVRYAFLGFGHHAAKRLTPAFAACEHSVLVGLWRRNVAAGAENAREFGIPHSFATREELCASPEIDAVFITSPDAMHLEDVLLAAAGGKAVLCEKPLAMSAAEAAAMARSAERAGIVFGVAQNFRWNASLVWLREQIAAGRIGSPQIAHAQFAYRADQAPRQWIMDPSLACGGPIGDVGVHCIDALRFVLGQEVVAIETMARTDDLVAAVEAYATMQMEMSDGCLAIATVSARAAYRTLIEVVGHDATIVIETGLTVDRPVEAVVLNGDGVIERRVFDNGDAYSRMLDDFSRAVRGEGSFAASGRDGVTNMRILDAAYASWRQRAAPQRLTAASL